jgi:hypothetical protein
MRLFLLFCCVFLLRGLLPAQQVVPHFSQDLPLVLDANREAVVSISPKALSLKSFCAVSVRLDGTGLAPEAVHCAVYVDGKWTALGHFEEEHTAGRFVSELYFADPNVSELRVYIRLLDQESAVTAGRVHLFSPTGTLATAVKVPESTMRGVAPCPQPTYVPRTSWGSAFGLTGDIFVPPAYYTNVTHLIVHHSAGSNSSSNWPGVVAAIFDFHVSTNGWADVGYNWLIDPLGGLYEGRGGGNNVRGAHMCGYNSNTMGVCYLGNFMLVDPPAPGIETLVKLLAWKCGDSNINPLGNGPIVSYTNNMKNISGHKDGCEPSATACPGDKLYPLLESLRTQVDAYINTVCNPSGAATPASDPSNAPTVSPNPTGGSFVLAWPRGFTAKKAGLQLFDTMGREVWEVTAIQSQDQTFHTNALPAGQYWLRVTHDAAAYWLQLHKL